MLHDVKITVLKRLFHEDLVKNYTDNPNSWTPCQLFKEGQTFTIPAQAPWNKPEDFCGWAWADMQKMIWGMSRGGPKQFVTCCTDGYRPVVFLLERLDPES
ncbi:TIGR04076 family protein [Pseudodesulfovibrio sp. F-1]|uniref:TIGR04076 family protein n=1 Tax=Pseudodesulfovibrio alkaliphilus TaxID=2661613 RepID=A0A7K1KM44_9BACT|nr:TIGR04076 family protein [Pseudodesulfovibrio alkaliphilus]MUM76952.1 TIGR04076 family protein [Pseudodesulfovibrio alkaliphilus]